MTCHGSSNVRWTCVAVLVAAGIFCSAAFAQGPVPEASSPSVEPPSLPGLTIATPAGDASHKFWDIKNRALFAAVAASASADFAVTRSNLQNGGQELNPIVRLFGHSTLGLALNFVGETGGSISLSYFFHKTHHHRLERAASMVNISGSLGAIAYGLKHR